MQIKKIFKVGIFFFMICCGIEAQSCLPGSTVFTTQSQIDNFAINYPGCTNIIGSLRINNQVSTTNINNLNGLSQIVSIDGNFEINRVNSLQNLQGLNSLTTIGGYFTIYTGINGPSSLTTLAGLDNLSSVGGGVGIAYNKILQNLNGIGSLSSIGGNLLIRQNTVLNTLEGLNPNLTLGTSLDIELNPNLSTCNLAFVCNHLSNPAKPADINNNAIGCATRQQVEISCSVMPIELITFIATSKEKDANLYWQTSSEINNHYFDIEYSKDGTDFTTLGRKEGTGNSNTLLDYHFVHKDVYAGMHYYRLKQVDYDGQYSYSDIKSVLVKGESDDLSIYPNPTNDFVYLSGIEDGNYIVRDFSGKIVRSGDFISSVLSLEGLSAGIYFVSLTNNDLNGVFKVHKL
jgi:Secretion system C-terminal sorting domain